MFFWEDEIYEEILEWITELRSSLLFPERLSECARRCAIVESNRLERFGIVEVIDSHARDPPGTTLMDPADLKKHVAKVVQDNRKRLGLSQVELGNAVGLSETTISRIERAEYLPTLEKVYALAAALEVHPVELMQGDSLLEFIEALPKDQLRELHGALGALIAKTKPSRK